MANSLPCLRMSVEFLGTASKTNACLESPNFTSATEIVDC